MTKGLDANPNVRIARICNASARWEVPVFSEMRHDQFVKRVFMIIAQGHLSLMDALGFTPRQGCSTTNQRRLR